MSPKNMPEAHSEGLYKFPYLKPEERSIWVKIYDPSANTFLGRTAGNWAALTFFYTVFFSALAAMFAICMYGLMSTINYNEPTYQLDSSLIGTNPGMGYRPYTEGVDRVGSLIWFVASNESNVAKWTTILDDFLIDYDVNGKENSVVCLPTDKSPPPDKVCSVDLEDFGPCTKENGYAYNKSSPCVFIKLNRIFNWVPDCYNDSSSLPEEMDQDLKDYIASQPANQRDIVWVSCYGENVADRENIGPIKFYPTRGFPRYYYPFTNTPGYLSPLVAAHFERPTVGTLINIECRAWAKNIKYGRTLNHREGSVHFEIMID